MSVNNKMGNACTIEEFRELAIKKLSYLEARGFVRAPSLEMTRSTVGSLVYVGKYVAFEFSFDVRDQCVDGQVVQVDNGRLLHGWDGGYSSDIMSHMIRKNGYRGGAIKGRRIEDDAQSNVSRMLDAYIDLLDSAGQKLLSDNEESLA